MEIDKKTLTAALSADPSVIEGLARQIAQTLGVPEERALAVARNSSMIRARIESMTERDLQNAAAMLGQDKAEQILHAVKTAGGEHGSNGSGKTGG